MINTHEAEFVRAFIVPGRRERWKYALAVDKKRGNLLDKLNHPKDIDFRFATRILPSCQDPVWIADRLRELGAGSTAYVISCHPVLDEQYLSLEEAIDSVVGLRMGTVVSCVPGRLAYFEGEEKGARCILKRQR